MKPYGVIGWERGTPVLTPHTVQGLPRYGKQILHTTTAVGGGSIVN